MDEKEFNRALFLTMHIERFTPGVYILHEHGFTDEDIASFYKVEIRNVLKARGVLQDPSKALFFDDSEEQLIARIKTRAVPEQ